MRLLITGETGVLGRALRSLAEAAGNQFAMPGHEALDLVDPSAVADAARGVDVIGFPRIEDGDLGLPVEPGADGVLLGAHALGRGRRGVNRLLAVHPTAQPKATR
ncbi:MAG TPA: hypothetical protein VFM57_12175 [Thermoleophilaceae bacterium]|nr:hypothetical protein [Thermoleophilaceae bacterium]